MKWKQLRTLIISKLATMHQSTIVLKLFFISSNLVLQVYPTQIQEKIATVLQMQQEECEQGESGRTIII